MTNSQFLGGRYLNFETQSPIKKIFFPNYFMSTISSDKRKNDSNGTGSPIKYGLLVKVDFGSIDTKYLLCHSNIIF